MSTFTLTRYPNYGILCYRGTPAEPKPRVLLAGRAHGRLSVPLCGSLPSPSVYDLQTKLFWGYSLGDSTLLTTHLPSLLSQKEKT